MKGGSVASEILCVGQLGCAEKKVENSDFNRGFALIPLVKIGGKSQKSIDIFFIF